MSVKQRFVVAGLALAMAFPALAAQEARDTALAPGDLRDRVNPVPPGPEPIRAGRLLWEQHCLTCHGEEGRGDGPNARLHEARKHVAPLDLTDPQFQDNVTDGEIFWRISRGLVEDGEVLMPSYEEKIPSQAQRWMLVHYVRTLRSGAP